MLTLTLLLFTTFLTTLYFIFKHQYKFWSNLNIPTITPSILLGNAKPYLTLKTHPAHILNQHYQQQKLLKNKEMGLYFFTHPVYIPLDLESVDAALASCIDRPFYSNEKDDPISANVLNLSGIKWKTMRTKLTSAFTTSKIKSLFGAINECTYPFQVLLKEIVEKDGVLDLNRFCEYFLKDLTGHVIFGLGLETISNTKSPFRQFMSRHTYVSPLVRLIHGFNVFFPKLSNWLGFRLFPKKPMDFFTQFMIDTIKYREDNNYKRKDLMQVLIDLKNSEKDQLTLNEVIAQAFIFFNAGFDTTSSTLVFALYEIAKNQTIQNRLRTEIVDVLLKYNNNVSYEAIQDMKYLNQVINETLRKHPPAPLVFRRTAKPFKGIPSGTSVVIPVLSIHHDPEYYPNPTEFDPERFQNGWSLKRPSSTFLPFGGGPRICIGLKLAVLEVGIGIVSVLKSYKIKVDEEKTRKELTYSKGSIIVLKPEDKLYLNLKKI